jgi:mycothiol synthase
LGTRQDFRRMGLARGLLLIGMQRLKENGMHIAKLSVDADNCNHAALLYESVGFSQTSTLIRFVKDVF